MAVKIQDILAEALQLSDPADRGAWLELACAGDATLRAEVESLLTAFQQAGDFFDHAASLTSGDRETERPGSSIGQYQLLELIGEGGFGTVWMAEQQAPVRRRVALKIIKLGMDTREVVARFAAERQALAIMDHPNIARVFDGGTTDRGRPFFVMELVNGIAITQYCDANQWPVRERLKLFIQVCQAVQHAHQKGVIHRDLKPSNVLVTVRDDEPASKVIDFGVAKATQTPLIEKAPFTRSHQSIGTPAYMSPEQAGLGGLDVDTRSDVYSLGVLLYELLTGRTPFDIETLAKSGYEAVLRTIREEEPKRPSAHLAALTDKELTAIAVKRGSRPAMLRRLVRGDLDWIVMKCLEKDRQRRYESASNLARDIEHHLRSEPVSAVRPSLIYRVDKFVRRNRRQLALGALSLAVLVLTALGLKLGLNSRAERAALRRAGTNVIFEVVTIRSPEIVERLLEANPRLVLHTNRSGATPLIEAAAAGQNETVRLLLRRGAQVQAEDGSGCTALLAAASKAQAETVAALLEAGADPNHVDQNGWTALKLASWAGAERAVRALLDKGAIIDAAPPPEVRTALHFAAFMGHDQIVALLLAHGAKANCPDKTGITPLHLAACPPTARILSNAWVRLAELGGESVEGARAAQTFSNLLAQAVFRRQAPAPGQGHQRVAQLLLANHADPLANGLDGATPLILAAFFTNRPVAEVLIASKSGLNAQTADGSTALNIAAARSANEIAALLLAAGADPNLADNWGFTPLHTATERGNVQLAEQLLTHNADPDLGAASKLSFGHAIHSGQTPLHTAALLGHVDVVRLLLDHGAFAHSLSPSGTPLSWAVQGGHKAAVELLLNKGAQPNMTSPEQDRTPLHWAAMLGNADLVRLLLQHGASNGTSSAGTPLHSAAAGREAALRSLLTAASEHPYRRNAFQPQAGSESDYKEVIRLLISSGADVNAPEPRYQRTPLFEAVLEGQVTAVESLLAAGASVSVRDSAGGTPLHAASESKASAGVVSNMVVRLLKAGADPGARQKERATPLHAAAMGGRPEVAALLLAAGADVNASGPFGSTPLHISVRLGHREAAAVLLERGADPDARNDAGNTAMHDAVDLRAIKLMALLLEHGAQPDFRYPDGSTPLMHSASWGDTDAISLFRRHGADVNAADPSGKTALIHAAAAGQVDAAGLLLDLAARITQADADGNSPLTFAAGCGRPEMVQLLLDRGARIEAKNQRGFTALYQAADHGHAAVVEVLLKRGAEVNACGYLDYTPLHGAAKAYFTDETNYVTVARTLLAHGADVNARSSQQHTPLHQAAAWGRSRVLELLLEANADPNLRDQDGHTPLDLAIQAKRTNCVELLLRAGAVR